MFLNQAISPLILATTLISVLLPQLGRSKYIYGVQAQEKHLEELKIGQSIEREITGGQVHRYQLMLSRGEYAHIVIEQMGVDVAVTMSDPKGKELCLIDSPNGTRGPEIIYFIAEFSGYHRLEVNVPEKDSVPGRYQAKVEALRMAASQDFSRAAWHRVFAEGMKLKGQSTAESMRAAIIKYQEAEKYLSEINEPVANALTFSGLGEVYHYLGERKKALDSFLQALPFVQATGDRNEEAFVLNSLGLVYNSLGDMQKALDSYDRSLTLMRASDNSRGEASVLNNLGRIYDSWGEKQRALDYYNQALSLMRAKGDRPGEALALNNLGLIYNFLGEKQKALDYYDQALPIMRAKGDRRGEALVLNNLGMTYRSIGEKQKALDYYLRSLRLRQVVGDRQGEGNVLNNLGSLYLTSGDRERALNYYSQSLQIRQAIGDRQGETATTNNIGYLYNLLGESQKALDYYNRALELCRVVGNPRGESTTLSNIGLIYNALGDNEKALDYYNKALRLKRSVEDRPGEAITLNNIGSVYADLGDCEKARENLDPALKILRAVSDRSGEALALYNLARVERQRGNLIEARSHLEAALDIIDSLRTKVDVYELRASYFASVRNWYELYISLLLEMHQQDTLAGHDVAALEAGERARARSLLEILAESGADIRLGADPSLLERERGLQQQLNARASAQIALLSRKHTAAQAESIAKQIDALTTQLQQVKAEIRVSSPRYAALTQPQPVKLSEIQQQLIDQNTLLLEYFLGRKQSYLWVVSSTSIAAYQLPPRAEIEKAAADLNDLLIVRSLASGMAETGRRVQALAADAKYWSQAVQLSHILFGPVASQLGQKRLLIVADGVLQSIPFAALPAPLVSSTTDGENRRPEAELLPLIAEHEIISLPSASTLAALRRETAGRAPAEKSLAVLADPVFTVDDSRVRRNESKVAKKTGVQSSGENDAHLTTRQMTGSGQETGVIDAESRFGRLLSTRREAAEIMALVPERERKQALDFEASRAMVLSPELSRYRIVHFATHGLLNSVHPELSGIVLSLVDERGDPQDGFLRLHDIYNLKLPAELVVLSACRTGLGKEIKGEGLIGLARGFMYAGVPRIVASLWKVDDRATSELMKCFYQGLLGPERLRPAEALRRAQLSIRKQKQWRAPYYWAAFVIQGEWK